MLYVRTPFHSLQGNEFKVCDEITDEVVAIFFTQQDAIDYVNWKTKKANTEPDILQLQNTGLYNAEGEALSISDVMALLPTPMINRVEVIDENGRSYVNWSPTNRTALQVQDNGRTLKVFVSPGILP